MLRLTMILWINLSYYHLNVFTTLLKFILYKKLWWYVFYLFMQLAKYINVPIRLRHGTSWSSLHHLCEEETCPFFVSSDQTVIKEFKWYVLSIWKCFIFSWWKMIDILKLYLDNIQFITMFSLSNWSLNWKSYLFMVQWSNRQLNHDRINDIINI